MTRADVERASRTSARPSALACGDRRLDADSRVVAGFAARQVDGFLVVSPQLVW